MTNALATFERRNVATAWEWRARTGEFFAPKDMETRHLFYVLRMIWNHSMPAHMEVGKYVRHYSFQPFYTGEYMRDAVYFIGRTLLRRNDLHDWQRAQLEEMAAWMRQAEFDEVFVLPAQQKRIAHA